MSHNRLVRPPSFHPQVADALIGACAAVLTPEAAPQVRTVLSAAGGRAAPPRLRPNHPSRSSETAQTAQKPPTTNQPQQLDYEGALEDYGRRLAGCVAAFCDFHYSALPNVQKRYALLEKVRRRCAARMLAVRLPALATKTALSPRPSLSRQPPP